MSIEHALDETARLSRGSAGYPEGLLACLGDAAPERIAARGNLDILGRRKLAFFCSVKCPGSLILQTYDVACSLRDAGVTVVSGFHSPMEKECLTLLLRGSQPIITCPARSIEGMRIPTEWRAPIEQGRLLVLSAFDEDRRKTTAANAARRNAFVAALADTILVAYAALHGKTEALVTRAVGWGKPTLTLDSPDNAWMTTLGARSVTPETVGEHLGTQSSPSG